MKKILRRNHKDGQIDGANVEKVYTLRFYMMIASAVVAVVGIGVFILYFATLNMAAGLAGIVMMVGGVFAFRYYWKKEDNITIEHINGAHQKQTDNANCFNIYPRQVLFETMVEPVGFPMECLNLKKKYYVNIWNLATKKLTPFILPDQQFYDPDLFSQRVLGLPAHKKIFERKPKLIQRLKTALLVAAIVIVWLLILTTTGG